MGIQGAPDCWFAGPVDDPRRYRVTSEDLERAESGGEGLVYRATRVDSDHTVALKLLTTATVDDFERIERRAASFAGVTHPNLMVHVEVLLGSALTPEGDEPGPNEFDVVMAVSDWIDGRSLCDTIPDAPLRKRVQWTSDLARALHRLHATRGPDVEHGIVHRDVKPSNVRIADDGRAVLIDFGVARPVHHSDMTVGVGTYRWRAPEVLSDTGGPVGAASDVWGLGAVAHWMLVGDPPGLDGSGASRERLERALGDRRNGVAIARHLAELLHSSPAKRPTDLAGWAAQLDRLVREPSARRRRVRLTMLGAGCAVGLVAFLPSSGPLAASTSTTTSTSTSTSSTTSTIPAGVVPTTVTVPTTTSTVPALPPVPADLCTGFKLNVLDLASLLNKLVVSLRKNPAADAFGLGLADLAIGERLNEMAMLAAQLDGLSGDAQLVAPADPTISRGLIVAWLATGSDGLQVDRAIVRDAIAFSAPLVEAAERAPADRAPLAERLAAFVRMYESFEDRGCSSGLWRSPVLRHAELGKDLRAPAADLAEFFARIDVLRDEFV